MKWTTEKPTKEGWYWFRQLNVSGIGPTYRQPDIYHIMAIGTHDRFLIEWGERQWDLALTPKGCLWAGPIEEPQE